MMAVDDLEAIMLCMSAGLWIPAPRFRGDKFTPAKAGAGMTTSRRAGPNHKRLVPAGPFDIANKPGEVPLAHPVGIARMSGELVDWNTRYSILDFCFSHYLSSFVSFGLNQM
jgi:hypothetical protein